MIFDTHCHYNLEPLFAEGNWQGHWQKAQDFGVKKSVVIGTDAQSSHRAVAIAQTDSNLFAAVAIHPGEYQAVAQEFAEKKDFQSEVQNIIQTQIADLTTLLATSKVVAIGETGLDYFHLQQDTSLSDTVKKATIWSQQEALKAHLRLAQEKQLPILLHVRDQSEQAYFDIIQILAETQFSGQFILHCVSGPTAYVQKALELGGYVSAAANITYKTAEHLRDLVRLTPPDRILVETDAPFLPPQQYRGQTCEPWMISETAKFLAEELAIPPELTWQNAHTFFHLE